MSDKTEIDRLRAENAELRRHAVELHWMARRYADCRSTYAVGMVNDATRYLLGIGLALNATRDDTVWAADGMGRLYDGLSKEEATPGTDEARGRHIRGPSP